MSTPTPDSVDIFYSYAHEDEALRDELEKQLVAAHNANTNIVVFIRADENGKNKDLYEVINRCQKNGITRFSLRTEPPEKR